MDESFPYPNLTYYSCGDLGRRNPVALKVKSEDMRQWLLNVPKDEVLCLDLETTGLNPHDNDEVLQISICDGNGRMLLNSYVHPAHRRRWSDAQAIHGITPAMVKDAPRLLDLSDAIRRLLDGCTLLIGYNIRGFDLEFLREGGIDLPRRMNVYDLINDCSVLYSYWNKKYGNYTYISLENVAKKLRVTYKPHDSSEDVKATVKVFYKLLNGAKMRTAVKSIDDKRAGESKPSTTATNATKAMDGKLNPLATQAGDDPNSPVWWVVRIIIIIVVLMLLLT